MRLVYINGAYWLVTETVPVTRHYSGKNGEAKSVEHMASTIERRATDAEVDAWRKQL